MWEAGVRKARQEPRRTVVEGGSANNAKQGPQ